MTIRETRKRLLRALNTLQKDAEKQLKTERTNIDCENTRHYLIGIKVAKNTVIKVMDNL